MHIVYIFLALSHRVIIYYAYKPIYKKKFIKKKLNKAPLQEFCIFAELVSRKPNSGSILILNMISFMFTFIAISMCKGF